MTPSSPLEYIPPRSIPANSPSIPAGFTDADRDLFERLSISEATLFAAGVERLTNEEARERLAIPRSRSGDMAGVYYPRRDPRDGRRTGGRIRRDHPEVVDGKPQNKYQGEIGGRPHLFFPPGVASALPDKLTPVVIVESEKAALALADLATRNQRGILPIATGGCWAWRGKTGRVETPDGVGADEHGPSLDFDLLQLEERAGYILFDSNTATNPKVSWARTSLAHYLHKRGARVFLPDLPQQESLNGPDDLIAVAGDTALLAILDSAPLFAESARASAARSIATIETQITPLTDDQETELYQSLAAVDSRDDRTRLINTAASATKGTLTKKQISAKVARLREELLRDRAADYEKELLISETGTPKPLLTNAVLSLAHHPDWSGVLRFNDFSLSTEIARQPPWPKADVAWNDNDDSCAAIWLQQHNVAVGSKVAAEATQVVARRHSYHPIRDYLGSLVWDGQPRLISWLHAYLGATDSALHAAIGTKWLIACVARIFQPGCQADNTLLLEAPQGRGKSTALRILAGDQYYLDHLSDIAGKDARIELLGKWIVELAEFVNRRSELERKGFLTATADVFRAPYDRRTRWVPRSCVFAATTNDATPLTDETGGRRYWCVTCGAIDLEKLRRDRDQLWAEAYSQYLAGETWHVDFAEFQDALRAEEENRYQDGPFDDLILPWLENPKSRLFDNHHDHMALTFDSQPGRILIYDILIHALGKAHHSITRSDQMTVRACLVHAGWQREKLSRIKGTARAARFYIKVTP